MVQLPNLWIVRSDNIESYAEQMTKFHLAMTVMLHEIQNAKQLLLDGLSYCLAYAYEN